MTEQKALIKNIEINYKVFGQGKPFLILHGWGSKSDRWEKVGELVSKNNLKVIIPDLPGFGKSQEPKTAWNLDDYCSFVEEFLNVLNLDSFYLAGHSFGGTISAKLAIKSPEKTEKLFLIASACIRKKTIKKQVLSKASKGLKIFSFLPFYSLAKKAFYKFIVGGSDYPKTEGIMKETFLKVVSEDLSSVLNRIKTPTVIIWGDKDDVTPVKDAYFINKEITGSKLEIIPNAGHDLEIKTPEILARKVLENLN